MSSPPESGAAFDVQHIALGKEQRLAILALKAFLVQDNGMWFVQGLDIDYSACGNTEKEAMDNFAKGLAGTLITHIEKYGNINRVNKKASQAVWDEFAEVKEHFELEFTMIRVTQEAEPVFPKITHWPYDGIAYARARERLADASEGAVLAR